MIINRLRQVRKSGDQLSGAGQQHQQTSKTMRANILRTALTQSLDSLAETENERAKDLLPRVVLADAFSNSASFRAPEQ